MVHHYLRAAATARLEARAATRSRSQRGSTIDVCDLPCRQGFTPLVQHVSEYTAASPSSERPSRDVGHSCGGRAPAPPPSAAATTQAGRAIVPPHAPSTARRRRHTKK